MKVWLPESCILGSRTFDDKVSSQEGNSPD